MVQKYICEDCGIISKVRMESDNVILACLKIQKDHKTNSPNCGDGKLRLVREE